MLALYSEEFESNKHRKFSDTSTTFPFLASCFRNVNLCNVIGATVAQVFQELHTVRTYASIVSREKHIYYITKEIQLRIMCQSLSELYHVITSNCGGTSQLWLVIRYTVLRTEYWANIS